MEEMIMLISNVGFPIAVATYLLLRLKPVIKGLQTIDHWPIARYCQAEQR